jgi:hypothetical protein
LTYRKQLSRGLAIDRGFCREYRINLSYDLNGLRQARGRKGGMSGATFRFAAGSSPTPVSTPVEI